MIPVPAPDSHNGRGKGENHSVPAKFRSSLGFKTSWSPKGMINFNRRTKIFVCKEPTDMQAMIVI